VNRSTGRTCDPTPESLATAVWDVLDNLASFAPRRWALRNMCFPIAKHKMFRALRRLERRKEWKINLSGFECRVSWAEQVNTLMHADMAVRTPI
jgi:hypothetical protein